MYIFVSRMFMNWRQEGAALDIFNFQTQFQIVQLNFVLLLQIVDKNKNFKLISRYQQ